MANPGNVAGGYKATISNPNTSEEAKDHAREVLENMESTGEVPTRDDDSNKNTGNVIGGHKANLKNPNTSEEAKENSRQVLEDMGADS